MSLFQATDKQREALPYIGGLCTSFTGVELVNHLIDGEPETTIGIKYESTLDGRKAASHERSVKAGSGDPKKEAERPGVGCQA